MERMLFILAFMAACSNPLANRAVAESFTTNIIDGVATNAAGPFTLGDTGPFNFLLITNGGRLTNTVGTIGSGAGALDNLAVVVGADSRWESSSTLSVGIEGSSNRLSVLDGGRVTSAFGQLGASNSSWGNLVFLAGASSAWETTGPNVGNDGSWNYLEVSGGAWVNGLRGGVGLRTNASYNLALVTGVGSAWTNSGRFHVGSAGSFNRLVVSNGGRLDATGSPAAIGDNASARGNSVLVTGPGSHWRSRDLLIGSLGTFNELVASDGARIESTVAAIGQACAASDNFALITGAGTVWTNGTLEVGFCSTNNSLIISNGATVLAGLVRSSVQGGASNTITVSGSGSLLRAAGDLILGNPGTANSFLIANGGRVEGRNDRIGWSGGNNAATLLNPGTSWSNTSLTIGDTTPGNHLTVADGARIDSGSAMLGAGSKSSGNNVMLSALGTVWNITTNLIVGGLGHSNRFSLADGASLAARNVHLGAGSLLNPTALFNSDGNNLRLEGTNTVLNAVSNLVVGASGRWNRVEVCEAAQLASRDAVLGLSYGSRSNSVLVTGSGSSWHNGGDLMVGSNGMRSELVISQGGRVTDNAGFIGFSGEPVGQGSTCVTREGGNKVLVTDHGSFWENTSQLYVGYGSIGNTLVISNGGIVNAASLIVGNTNGIEPGSSCGPITNANRLVVDGGCLLVTNARFGSVLNVRHGTLTLNRGRIETGEFRLLNGSVGRMEFRGGTFRTFDSLVRNGLPFEVGDGLHRAVFYVDSFDSGFEILNINPHGVLRAGNALNSTTVTNAGTIVPGGYRSLWLYVEGPFTQLPEGNLSFDIGGRAQGSNYAYLVCRSTARLDGSLRLNLSDGFVPAPSDLFEIVRAATLIGTCTNAPHGARLKTLDNLGSFVVSYSPTNVVLSDYQSTDLDGDGLEDAWATNHFGHTPLTSSEKLADADGDGAGNADEFRAGTDPTNATSVFKAVVSLSGETALVEFECVDGKTYRVWFSNDLQSWQEVLDPTFAFPQPGRCQWLDDGKDTGGRPLAPRFYRVSVE